MAELMNEKEKNIVVAAAVLNQMGELRDIHRSIVLSHSGGISAIAFAESRGVGDVALDVFNAAKEAACKVCEEGGADDAVRKAARMAAVNALDSARRKELLFLRDGSRSATVLLAYELALVYYDSVR